MPNHAVKKIKGSQKHPFYSYALTHCRSNAMPNKKLVRLRYHNIRYAKAGYDLGIFARFFPCVVTFKLPSLAEAFKCGLVRWPWRRLR